MSRRFALPLWLLSVACLLGLVSSADAWGYYPPVRVEMGFRCWFKVYPLSGPAPCAPWYAYFPCDPCMQALQHGGHTYPSWPNTPPPCYGGPAYGGHAHQAFPTWPNQAQPVSMPPGYSVPIQPIPNFGSAR